MQVLRRPAGHRRLRVEAEYTTQAPSVYGDLSAAGKVRNHAAVHRQHPDAVSSALQAVRLSPLANSLAGTMSGGAGDHRVPGGAVHARRGVAADPGVRAVHSDG